MTALQLICILAAGPALAGQETPTKLQVFPYAGYLTYQDTVAKEAMTVGGLYGYYGYGLCHSFEGDVGLSRIRYGQTPTTEAYNLDQVDATLVYNNYSVANLKLRGGAHTLFSDDDATDGAYVLFGGLSHYQVYEYDLGVDAYLSVYDAYVPDSLWVVQVTGTAGFCFGDYPTYGSFYTRTRGHYIHLSDDVGYGDQSFTSVEQSLSYYYQNLTLEAFVWVGSQVFGVQKDGFVVYNLAEKNERAYGGTVTYALGERSTVKLEASRVRFRELGGSDTAHALRFMLMVSYTF